MASLNFEGMHETSELVMSQRFETPLDFNALKAKMIKDFGEPDYAKDSARYDLLAYGWYNGQYLWSDAFSSASESDLSNLRVALDLRDAEGATGVWLRMQMHMTKGGQVNGIRVELGNQTLNVQRAERSAAFRREEQERMAAEALERLQLN